MRSDAQNGIVHRLISPPQGAGFRSDPKIAPVRLRSRHGDVGMLPCPAASRREGTASKSPPRSMGNPRWAQEAPRLTGGVPVTFRPMHLVTLLLLFELALGDGSPSTRAEPTMSDFFVRSRPYVVQAESYRPHGRQRPDCSVQALPYTGCVGRNGLMVWHSLAAPVPPMWLGGRRA